MVAQGAVSHCGPGGAFYRVTVASWGGVERRRWLPMVGNNFIDFQYWNEGRGVDGATDWIGEKEATWATLRFSFLNSMEGGRRQCKGRRLTGTGGGDTERPRREKGPRVGRWWAENRMWAGPVREFPQKNLVGLPRLLGWIEELNRAGSRIIFEYIFKAFGFKFKDLNIFKSQTKLNLNKLFGDFSNLKLLKISLNIQIQTKA
jgi:hypothetical protein